MEYPMADNARSILSGSFRNQQDNNTPDYLSKSGYELLSDQDAIAEVRDYYAANGVYFNNTSEMWDKFYTDKRWSDVNSLSMGLDAVEFATAGDSGREKLSRLSKLWAQAPSRGGVLDKVIDYGVAGVADPINLIGVGAGGAAVKAGQGARLAGKTLEQATKAATKAGIQKAAAGEAAIGAGTGLAFDAAQQGMEIAQGVSEDFDVARLAGAGIIDAGVSGLAAGLLVKGGSMLGIGEVAKGVGSLGDWDNTRLGSMLVQEQGYITREREAISSSLSGVTDQNEIDTGQAALADLTIDEQNIAAVQQYVNNMDLELDDLAKRFQDETTNGNASAASQVKQQFDALAQKRARVLEMEPDELFASGELQLQQRADTQPAESTQGTATQEPTGQTGSQGETTQEVEGTQESTQVETDTEDTGSTDLEPNGNAPQNVPEETIEWDWVNDEQKARVGEQLGLDGDELDAEMQRRVNDGSLKVTKGGKLYRDTYAKLTKSAKAADEVSEPEVEAEVDQQVDEALPEQPAVQEEDVADAAQSTDGNTAAFDEAVRKYEKIMDMSKGSSEFLDNMDAIIRGMLEEGQIDSQVFRYLRQLLGMHADADSRGINVANADEVVKMRREFLDREETLPDIKGETKTIEGRTSGGAKVTVDASTDDATAKRSAGSTAKAQDALEKGVKTAGTTDVVTFDKKTGERIVKSVPQSFLRRGFEIGDGYTVINAKDRFPKQRLTLDILRELAKKEGTKARNVYAYRAVGGETVIGKKGVNKRAGKAAKGETVFYSPRLDKVYSSEEMAMKAMGLKVGSKTAKTTVSKAEPEPMTSTEAVEARDGAFEKFKKTGSLEDLEKDIETVDAATGQTAQKAEKTVKQGGEVKRDDIPDIPRERDNGKIFAMIPREVGKKGTWFRKISPKQTDPRQVIARANLDDYYLGYVSPNMTAKDRKKLLADFEPFGEGNDPYENPLEKDVEVIKYPLSEQEARDMRIELNDLDAMMREGVELALDVADASARMKDAFKNNTMTVYDLHILNRSLFDLPFDARQNFGSNAKVRNKDLSFAHRTAVMKNALAVQDIFAPDGIRFNGTNLEDSIRLVKDVTWNSAPANAKANFEKLLRAVIPDDGNAPKFVPTTNTNAFVASTGKFHRGQSNAIMLNVNFANESITGETGFNPEFVLAHEMGHWMWVNALDTQTKLDFLKGFEKFYDENGVLYKDAALDIIEKSPAVVDPKTGEVMIGASNFAENFNEYFANQFALFITQKYDMLSVPDQSIWEKVTALVKYFVQKIQGKEIIDQDFVPLFQKLIIDDVQAERVSVMNPVEPTTNKGKAIRIRFTEMSNSFYEARAAYDDKDLDRAAERLADFAKELRGMSTTKKEAAIIARKNDEPLRPYSGAFAVVGRHHTKMKKAAQAIESVTRKFKMDVKTKDGEDFDGIGFGPEVYDGIADIFEKEQLDEFVKEVQATMNRAYEDVEGGDIPEFKATSTEIARREALPNGVETIKRAQRFKRVKGRANAAKRKRAATGRNIKNSQKVKDTTAAPDIKDAPKVRINELDINASIEAYERSLNNGAETKQSKKLRSHIVGLIRSMPNATPVADKNITNEVKAMRTPELIQNYTKAITMTRNAPDTLSNETPVYEFAADIARAIEWELQRRGEKNVVTNSLVFRAIETEKMMDADIGEDPSIPSSLPYTARNALRAITHRTSELQSTARKIAARLMYIGAEVSPKVTSESFKNLRNDVRKIAGEVTKSDDIMNSLETVSRYVYNSNILPAAQKETLRRATGAVGYDPSEVLARLVAEDAGVKVPKRAASVLDTVDEDFAKEHMFDVLNDVRTSMREGVAYVLNGLIAKPNARRNFAPLMTYGNMLADTSRFDPTSPKNKFIDDVPAEFAEDFAADYIQQASPNTIRAMQDFVKDGDIVPYYVDVSNVGPLRSGIRVDATPLNKISRMPMNDLSDEVRDVLDELRTVRSNINTLRARQGSRNSIQQLYYEEEALRLELAEMGVPDKYMSTPVLIRDTKPANFKRDMIPSDGIVKVLSRAIREADDMTVGMSQSAAILDAMRGSYKPSEMLSLLQDAAGGEQKLTSIMRDMGFTSININGQKTMLNDTDVRDLRAALFDEPEMAFNENMPSDPVPHVIDAMEIANDNGDQAFEDVLSALEIAGMPKKTTDILAKIKRKKEITPNEGREIRRVAKFGLVRNNAQRLARSGMRSIAEFFEPSDAGAGHFERYALRTGQFLGPLQRMLIKLPDSGNGMKRWLQNGLGEMLYAYNVGESIGSMLRIPPPTRKMPIGSHLRIIGALRNEGRVSELTSQEREIHEYMRTYFKEARDRLVSSGYDVGNIRKNYVPQVWRRDLIEADREGFVDILSKYFTAEHAERGAVLKPQQARLKAEGIADRLIHEDGVWVGDAHAFNRSGERGVDHVDYQRLIRLDESWAAQFTDMRNPDNNLAKFLENDLMVIGAKYADSVEQRIDIADRFGVGGFGYFDYLSVMNGGTDAIARLLRSNKVLRKDYKLFIDPSNTQDEVAGEGAHAIFQSNVFMAPIQKGGPEGQMIAEKKAKELAQKAHDGASVDEIHEDIMSMVEPDSLSSGADQMRKNFSFRARAIAEALTDTKGLDKDYMPQSHMVEEADNLFKAVARKPVYNASFEKHLEKPSSWLRSFNSVTLLPFVTLSSLGDVVLPLIRSGSLRSSTEAYRKWMVDPDVGPAYREMIRNVGASTQNIVQERMSRAFGMDTTRFSAGFFTAIGLTDWTNTMRDISAAVSYEWFKSQQEIAVRKPNTKAGRQARRVLDEYGLGDLYKQPGMNIERILRSGSSADVDQMYYQVAGAMHRFANETIFTPNPLDIPLWAQSPIGQMIFQLKSFPLMMTRMGYTVYKEAKDHKNFMPLMYFAGAPVVGAGVVGAKDVVQGRGGEENREFAVRDRRLEFLKDYGISDDEGVALALGWYRDGLMQMGGLGLIGSLMYDTASQLDNGAYGAQRITEMLLGPSLGVLHDAQTILAGGMQAGENAIMGEGSNGKPRAAVREIVSRVPLIGQTSGVRETIVDTLAGEPKR
jgi:hypothetical protein